MPLIQQALKAGPPHPTRDPPKRDASPPQRDALPVQRQVSPPKPEPQQVPDVPEEGHTNGHSGPLFKEWFAELTSASAAGSKGDQEKVRVDPEASTKQGLVVSHACLKEALSNTCAHAST